MRFTEIAGIEHDVGGFAKVCPSFPWRFLPKGGAD